jgi:hypothetical protein
MKRTVAFLLSFLLMLSIFGCRLPEKNVSQTPQATPETVLSAEQTEPAATAEQTPTLMPTETLMPTDTPQSAQEIAPDGKGVINFTIVLHLEGWHDGENETSFRRHAEQLREYADLFEQYGATMSLESKEIIDGCINWNDNVLLELQQRGHAVGIHADAGGQDGATIRSIVRTLTEMRGKLLLLGINATFASGVASKANWVKACEDAEIDTVSCMVAYGLWSLDESLRPAEFEPYRSPSVGHAPYPFELEDRLTPWLAEDGSNWIIDDPAGKVLIIPSGLSLNNAYEELNGITGGKSELDAEDIETWREILPRLVEASDSGKVNTFYAVWSFGSAVDMGLLEEWLQLIDGHVQSGNLRWSTIPEMAELYRANMQ